MLREQVDCPRGMERNPIMPHAAAKVEPEADSSEMIKEVIRLVQKDGALNKKQAQFSLSLKNVVSSPHPCVGIVE